MFQGHGLLLTSALDVLVNYFDSISSEKAFETIAAVLQEFPIAPMKFMKLPSSSTFSSTVNIVGMFS